MKLLVIFLVVAVLGLMDLAHGLSCIPCGEYVCKTTKGCKYGIVKDVCACCDICAKGEGEECQGMWGILGECGEDYDCTVDESDRNNYYPGYPEEWLRGTCTLKASAYTQQESYVKSKRQYGVSSKLAGSAKISAKKHPHKAFSGIPPRYLALLKQYNTNKGR